MGNNYETIKLRLSINVRLSPYCLFSAGDGLILMLPDVGIGFRAHYYKLINVKNKTIWGKYSSEQLLPTRETRDNWLHPSLLSVSSELTPHTGSGVH